jgi:hypothetical protein
MELKQPEWDDRRPLQKPNVRIRNQKETRDLNYLNPATPSAHYDHYVAVETQRTRQVNPGRTWDYSCWEI